MVKRARSSLAPQRVFPAFLDDSDEEGGEDGTGTGPAAGKGATASPDLDLDLDLASFSTHLESYCSAFGDEENDRLTAAPLFCDEFEAYVENEADHARVSLKTPVPPSVFQDKDFADVRRLARELEEARLVAARAVVARIKAYVEGAEISKN